MVHTSQTPTVGFFCHSDADWTVAEGVESLLAFLDCPPDVFEQTYRNSFLKLITHPRETRLPQPHAVQAYGIACICSAERKEGRWLVQLDRLPFGLQREDQEVGLFRLVEGTRVVWQTRLSVRWWACPKRSLQPPMRMTSPVLMLRFPPSQRARICMLPSITCCSVQPEAQDTVFPCPPLHH